ncbi:UAA transporter [Cantharellus anzutake]|uniref:UAA transporter n=1 Tax=Cantharellus anzutake TaxID=1750568 RepID=UPI0019054922|nr:UAA transporter [Cantharellus anzutake]KAF8333497.1 UAA transporter [Cantharellus anzutake]
MAILKLGVCVAGVYSMFLLWAIAQERLAVPFASTDPSKPPERFHSALFLNTLQSLASVISSAIYIWIRRVPGQSLAQIFGLKSATKPMPVTNGKANGHANGNDVHGKEISRPKYARDMLLRCLQCAIFVSTAAQFGFAALSHISYPTMVLGKSCKLVPVMIMNVLLYRRKFAPHKYLVVALVTIGITAFMGSGDASAKGAKHKGNAQSSIWGIFLLLINLIIDGATNSTQDEIFAQYRITGQQMMFWLNAWSTILTSTLIMLPLPYLPILHPTSKSTLPDRSELQGALSFIRTHPEALKSLLEFSVTGSLGQLFIFETLQHFGSLTLVMVTLTRKLFTMILSVVVYNHKLTYGQWLGAAIVFAGIGVEAWVKRKEIYAKRSLQEREKGKIKAL